MFSKLLEIQYRGALLYVDYDFGIHFFSSFFQGFWANFVQKTDVFQTDWNLAQWDVVKC